MNATKNALLQCLFGISLLLIGSCDCTCPVPVPTISVDEDGIYSVKVDSVSEATKVDLKILSAQGQLLDSLSFLPGEAKLIPTQDENNYPIQLKFKYLSANGKTVAEDAFDLSFVGHQSGGIIAMDVVIGFSAPNPAPSTPPSCPSSSVIATGTGEVTFNWANDDWFDVSITNGASTTKIGIMTKGSTIPGNPGSIMLYRSDVYNCLNNPNCAIAQDLKTGTITLSSSPLITCAITGVDDGGNSIKTIKLSGSGSSFLVKKH